MNMRILPLAVLVTACNAAPTTTGDAARRAVESEVRAAAAGLQNALNAHDPEEILGFYALDEDFVYAGCTNLMFGGDVFRRVITQYHSQHPDAVHALEVRQVRALGPGQAVVSLQGRGGSIENLFVTRVMERGTDGRWGIAHEHESWPGCDAPPAPHPGTAPGDTVPAEPGGELP